MANPVAPGPVVSALGTIFKLAELCLNTEETDEESRIFLTLIDRVRKDLYEALRERREKEALLRDIPEKRAWIDGSIIDTQTALTDIETYIENAQVSVEDGKAITLQDRYDWVLNNREKLVMREMALATCHRSLLSAIDAMHILQMPMQLHMQMQMSIHPPRNTSMPYLMSYDPSLDFYKVEGDEEERDLMRPSRRKPRSRIKDVELPAESETPLQSPIMIDSASISPAHNERSRDSSNMMQDLSKPPMLPEIQLTSFSMEDSLENVGQDSLKTLSTAANALETQPEGVSVISLFTKSVRQSVAQERRRRARARLMAE